MVEKNLDVAWSYHFGVPEDTDYFSEFLELMDRTLDEREFFLKDWRYRHGELEIDDDPLDRENVKPVDDISELFCDECDSFAMRVGVKGEKHICPGCWQNGDWKDQSGFDSFEDVDTGTTYVLVGCGKEKRDGRHPARELYKSPYFEKKREVAEELGDEWWIVSAEHGLLDPGEEIECYDTTIEEIDVTGWLDRVKQRLDEEGISNHDWAWVMVGGKYLDRADDRGRTLRSLLDSYDWVTRYPFNETSGIGEQNQYLSEIQDYDEFVMPSKIWDEPEGQTTFNDF